MLQYVLRIIHGATESAADRTFRIFQVARVVFGVGSIEQMAVKKGWTGVEVTLKAK